jgi:hypothetical protein
MNNLEVVAVHARVTFLFLIEEKWTNRPVFLRATRGLLLLKLAMAIPEFEFHELMSPPAPSGPVPNPQPRKPREPGQRWAQLVIFMKTIEQKNRARRQIGARPFISTTSVSPLGHSVNTGYIDVNARPIY